MEKHKCSCETKEQFDLFNPENFFLSVLCGCKVDGEQSSRKYGPEDEKQNQSFEKE
ncbi:MAG: hypothetical protein N2517_00100 [Ignavibacteria bacterium]|nr:hypothetical protein [Ignavibacteria bacterium]